MGNLLTYLNALPLQAEPVSEESDNPLLQISPGLMVWTLVMFGITLWIMKKYVFGPVGDLIEKRRRDIAQSIEDAERGRNEATALLDEYKAKLIEARKEADSLRDQGRKEGESQRAELVAQGQVQRERVLADAGSQIDAQARQAASGLRDDVVDIALLAAEKVSRKSLDDADHRRLIEEAIAEADLSGVATANGGSSTS